MTAFTTTLKRSGLFPLLLLLSFLHGIFSAGFIPILNQVLGKQSSWAFALYFLGLLLGQLLVYRWRHFSTRRWHLSLYEILFGATLLIMGLFASKEVLMIGRGFEGLAGGLATPLIFSQVIQAPSKAEIGQKIVRYNGSYALGFVLGPILLELAIHAISYRICLMGVGIFFMLFNLALSPLLLQMDQVEEASLKLRKLFGNQDWFEKYFTLFYSKCFYGFLLSFVTSFAAIYFGGWPISVLTLIMAGLFVGGQQLGARTLFRFDKQAVEILLPIALGLTLMLFWATGWRYLIFFAALQHAYLIFIAFLNFTTQMKSGREFALFNSLSDPGMVLGAVLAGFQLKLVWVLMLLALLPLLYYRRIPRLLKTWEPPRERQI